MSPLPAAYKQTKLVDPKTVLPSVTIRLMTNTAFVRFWTAANIPECNSTLSSIRPSSSATVLYGLSTGDYPDNAERFAMYSRAVFGSLQDFGSSRHLPLSRLDSRR